MELISREAAIAAISDDKGIQYPGWWYKDKIRTMPGVEAAEIVRCRDCKYYKLTNKRAFGCLVRICGYTGFEDVDDDDFCSRAERREA